MSHNTKIVLTTVKVGYSIAFMLILALIRGISNPQEIGVAMDANVALLATIFCSDLYYQEIQDKRFEVFNLLSIRSQHQTICRRLFIQMVYISFLIGLDYWVFNLKFINDRIEVNILPFYLAAVFACTASALFFGTLSFTLVNLFKNLWAGIGSAFLIWLTLNSTIGKRIPRYINVFGYGNSQDMGFSRDWVIGKLMAVIAAVLFIYFNKIILIWKRRG